MKEILIALIELIGNGFEFLSHSKNLKRTLLLSFILFIIVIVIVYYLTKDFNTVNTISH